MVSARGKSQWCLQEVGPDGAPHLRVGPVKWAPHLRAGAVKRAPHLRVGPVKGAPHLRAGPVKRAPHLWAGPAKRQTPALLVSSHTNSPCLWSINGQGQG